MSVEDERAYLVQQMLSQVLIALHDRSVGDGDSPWRVPNLVTGMIERGMMDRGMTKEDGGERVENKMGGYSGQGENDRNKRREKLYSFIKKTVVPYPRLG